MLVWLQLAFLDQTRLLLADAFEEDAGRLVIWILRNKFSLDALLADGLFEEGGKRGVKFI